MKKLVLAGSGHAHLMLLQGLIDHPINNAEVVLITPCALQWYSGMLPGFMAGHYKAAECQVSVSGLVAGAGVRLMVDTIAFIHADQQRLDLASGGHIDYDFLSLNMGSETDCSWVSLSSQYVMAVKPIDAFVTRWKNYQQQVKIRQGSHLAVVGGGAAGVEMALAAQYALAVDSLASKKNHRKAPSVSLVTGSAGLLPGHHRTVVGHVKKLLRALGITLYSESAQATKDGLQLDGGTVLTVDGIIAASGAKASQVLQGSALALDREGFVLVDAQHRSISHSNVFAVGDICARQDHPLAKSGLHAVHAGPVLAHNLAAVLVGKPLKPYQPKRKSLYLISAGNKYAVLSWGGFSAAGRWVWYLKNWIDRRFIKRFI